MHSLRLIRLYYEVCELCNTQSAYSDQRFSTNGLKEHITDEELITIYLSAHICASKFEHKQIYEYTKNHWTDWLSDNPSYQVFNNRMNQLTDAFASFLEYLLIRETGAETEGKALQVLLGDSFPIVTCSGRRKGKSASDLCRKTYCASKSMWYYGVKIHLFGGLKKRTFSLHTASERGLPTLDSHKHAFLVMIRMIMKSKVL